MKILRTVCQGQFYWFLFFKKLPGVCTTLWKRHCLYTCMCSYGFYLSLKAFMVTIVPFIRNWKALNNFRPVENFHMILKQK